LDNSLREKKKVFSITPVHISNMSTIEHRAVIKFFTRKGLNATDIHKELDSVYGDSAPSYRTVAKWVAEFKDPERGFEDAPRSGRPSTTVTDENIQAIERIVMRDRQISVRRVANELGISKTRVHEIMDNHLGMSKVCTRWVPKLLTPVQRINRVECCQELLQESEEDPAKFLGRIVTGDESWIYHYDPLSQSEAKVWKKPEERTPTRPRQQRSTEKVMMTVFWDEDGILLTDYLARGSTITGPYYASLIKRLRSTILEKRRGKVSHGVLLLHDNAPVHKSNIVQAAIRQAGFVELNHPAYSPDIAPTDYHLFSHLKKFMRGKNFGSDDEAIQTVEDYLCDLDSEFFSEGIQSLCDRWQRVVASDGEYIQ
jgi:histone-lysine N-methyltransferase SETMAR